MFPLIACYPFSRVWVDESKGVLFFRLASRFLLALQKKGPTCYFNASPRFMSTLTLFAYPFLISSPLSLRPSTGFSLKRSPFSTHPLFRCLIGDKPFQTTTRFFSCVSFSLSFLGFFYFTSSQDLPLFFLPAFTSTTYL